MEKKGAQRLEKFRERKKIGVSRGQAVGERGKMPARTTIVVCDGKILLIPK